jgi:hypothetical protein
MPLAPPGDQHVDERRVDRPEHDGHHLVARKAAESGRYGIEPAVDGARDLVPLELAPQ